MKLLREYIKELLSERASRKSKTKRTLYHINMRPARPQPKKDLLKVWDRNAVDPDTGERTGDLVPVEGTEKWERYWLKQPVKSGVFLTPNAVDISMNHGRSGNVYAYKVPEWVINKSGGMHRYDRGSEVLIPEDVWNEAGDEIEFLGKAMSRKELDNKTWKEQQNFGRGLTRSGATSYRARFPGDERAKAPERIKQARLGRSVQGLLSTKHPEAAVKMMKADEKQEVIAYLEDKLEAAPARFEKIPGERKGMIIPSIAAGLSEKEEELLALLKKHLKESAIREYVRQILVEKTIAIGQCYPHAVKMAQQVSDEEVADLDKFKVVHGRVTDVWSGESYEHAWVEKGDMIFDWQTHQTKPDGIPRDVYYETFQPEAYEEYTAEEAMVNCAKSGQAGPWR